MGERERIQAAEEALARRRRVVAKLEAQANCQAQQQRAFARVGACTPALPSLLPCDPVRLGSSRTHPGGTHYAALHLACRGVATQTGCTFVLSKCARTAVGAASVGKPHTMLCT